jgi:uncharacterized protein YbaA (DUF1428 family)
MNNKSEEKKMQLNELYRLMRDRRVTKEEIMLRYNISERAARDMISEITKRVPVIATSDNKGYKRAVSAADVEEVIHSYNEDKKRADEILKRNAPRIEFLRQYGISK